MLKPQGAIMIEASETSVLVGQVVKSELLSHENLKFFELIEKETHFEEWN